MNRPDPEVVVVGSVNGDVVVDVERPPVRGETVLGGSASRGPGGKGANQVVALARLGRRVGLVGCTGRDAEGEAARGVLRAEGVVTEHLAYHDSPTGLAIVLRDSGADSTIVVASGANAEVAATTVHAARPALAAAHAVMCQLEIPIEAVRAAAEAAGGLFVLNPAPGRPLPKELLDRVDVLVPNRHELAALAGTPLPARTEDVARVAARLRVRRTVVTLGADGCLVCHEDGRAEHVPAVLPAAVTDATAAGDAFCAGLVDALLSGADLTGAAGWAVRVAAVTITRPGAMLSLPRRQEVLSRT